MDFEVLILGTDANAYYMARCTYEAYGKKAYLIGRSRLAFTKFSNILNVSYEKDIWQEKEFLRILKEFQSKHLNKKIILISTNETYTEFIAKNKDKISKNYIYNIPDLKIIKSLTNKEEFYKKYKDFGLSFPKTVYYNTQNETKILTTLEYPVILKPSNVVMYNHLDFTHKKKIYKLENEEELISTINDIKESGYTDKLIIQEFIPGGDDALFDSVAYVNKKKKIEFLSFAQIGLQEHTKNMVGNAAVLINGFNTFKGDTKNEAFKIKKFLEDIDYQGFAEIDMKYDYRDNTFKVLEINARQGRCSYYLTLLGKNLVKVLVEDILYDKQNNFKFLEKEVLLSFVPKGIVKKYVTNKEFKKKALKMWKNVCNPMNYKKDRNIKRFLMLRKRWFHYKKEYKNGYWR